ncbi:response regulator [Flavobacteriaceae bacterium 3-367]|uniref:response regulator n=1 Tax=Eudoraea algarum TaxID=3417568 RepID=UPI00326D0492
MELNVCIIDDDLVSQFASRYSIEQSNSSCRIITCDNGEDGLDTFYNLLQNHEDVPDIVFLDLQMGGMDGWEFLEKFKSIPKWPKTTDIYILSAFTNSKDRARAKEHPMIQGYFDKPLSKKDVDKIFVPKAD